jgi:hypothetical protein
VKQPTAEEQKEQQGRVLDFFQKELDGKPFMVSIAFVAEEKRDADRVSHSFATMRVANVKPADTDFMTFKGLLTSLHFQINQYITEMFPKPVAGSSQPEQGTHYG